jgi:dihydrofolate reductase
MFSVSLDGFIERDGEFGWAAPDQEEHEFYNEQARQIGVELYGRRLYELMNAFWPTADEDPANPEFVREFSRIWKATPIIVFSTTLDSVSGNATLATGSPVDEVRRLKALPGKDIAVGGATLAASLIPHGLIDEYRLLVHPTLAGGGTPFFPELAKTVPLRLIETRTFGSGVVYLRYATMTT